MGVTPAKRGVGSISVADGSDRGAGAPYRTEGIEYLGNAAMIGFRREEYVARISNQVIGRSRLALFPGLRNSFNELLHTL